MKSAVFAAGAFFGLSFGEVAIALVIIGAILGVLYLALQEFGVPIPGFFIKALWIILIAVVAVLAIRFLMSL